jgi:hypothetical protein
VVAAAVPERSVHVLSVQFAVQLHSNEPTAIDSTSPARPKSSRYPPQPTAYGTWRSKPQRVRCPIRDVLRSNKGTQRFGGYGTLPMRHAHRKRAAPVESHNRAGEGRHLRVRARSGVRVSVSMRASVVVVVLVVLVDSRYGAGWDRDFPESGYPDKGPRKLGDGVIGAAVVGAAVVGAAVLVVVQSGWLAASRPPVMSGLK